MVAAAWGVDRGPELQFCQDIGRRPGALRALTKALRNATFAARPAFNWVAETYRRHRGASAEVAA